MYKFDYDSWKSTDSFYGNDDKLDQEIENEMFKVKEDAIFVLSEALETTNQSLVKDLIMTIIEGYRESLPMGKKLAERFELGHYEMLAFEGLFDQFKEQWLENNLRNYDY